MKTRHNTGFWYMMPNIVEFPEFEIRFYQGDSYFTISGTSVEDFKSIMKEKLKDHE